MLTQFFVNNPQLPVVQCACTVKNISKVCCHTGTAYTTENATTKSIIFMIRVLVPIWYLVIFNSAGGGGCFGLEMRFK